MRGIFRESAGKNRQSTAEKPAMYGIKFKRRLRLYKRRLRFYKRTVRFYKLRLRLNFIQDFAGFSSWLQSLFRPVREFFPPASLGGSIGHARPRLGGSRACV